MKDNHAEVKTTLILILVLNIIVTLAKAVFGVLANSLSMVADALHSLFDSTSNIIGLVAVERACKPPDEDHPYGHRRYEIFATLIIAFLLLVSALEIFEGVIDRILNPTLPQITVVTFLVMISTMIINYFVSRFEHERGVHLHSAILVADSQHTKSDVYASLSVIVGFIFVKAGYPVFDALIALFIVAFIGRTGYRILRDNGKILCDASPLNDSELKEFVLSLEGVKGCHKVRSRGTENQVFLDLHVQIDSEIPFRKAHKFSHIVETELKRKYPEVADVVIHIEPASDNA